MVWWKDANDSLHLSALRYANVGSGNLIHYATDITPGTGQSAKPSLGDSCSFEFYPGPIGNCDSAHKTSTTVFGKSLNLKLMHILIGINVE
ncbi:MAG: hypothetical protein CM15mP65_23170 [Crocinitomicaceae bacterium]|nr:MAG: hypothetical protein CM15mP65_23170 [Crocinitomicaceae bacterium]